MAAIDGCAESTQITLVITTDLACADLGAVSIAVERPDTVEGADAVATTRRCEPVAGSKDAYVGTLVVTPGPDPSALVAIKVTTSQGTADCLHPPYGPTCIVARRQLRFIDGASLTVPIGLRSRCVGTPCEASQTCFEGGCVDAVVANSAACSGDGCSEAELFGGGSGGSGAGGEGGGGKRCPGGADDGTGKACPNGVKRVFVTAGRFAAADLGGLDGADCLCNEAARKAGIPGSFRAWLSNSTGSPSTRFAKPGGPWFLTDCATKVAADFTSLAAPLESPIYLTELGQEVAPSEDSNAGTSNAGSCRFNVFTNTLKSGAAKPGVGDEAICAGWTGDGSSFSIGVGTADKLTPSVKLGYWTCRGQCAFTSSAKANPCHDEPFLAHLYCFEQ